MNSNFSFERLFGLIRKQWIENSRFYLLGSLALFGLMTICMIFFWVLMDGRQYSESFAYSLYLIGLFLTGTIYGSISFSILGSKEKGQYWLSFPASHAEKLVTSIFYNVILFFIIYTLSFLVVKWGCQLYIESYISTHKWASLRPMDWENGIGEVFYYFVWGYFCLQALFMLGSVYFKQYAFIKTAIFVSIIAGVFTFLLAKVSMNFFQGYGFNMENLEIRDHHVPENYGIYKSYSLGTGLATTLRYLLTYCWIPVFWLITWYRLKEKEL